MRRRRRLLISLALLPVVLTATIALYHLTFSGGRTITRINFDRIQIGMTYNDVSEILRHDPADQRQIHASCFLDSHGKTWLSLGEDKLDAFPPGREIRFLLDKDERIVDKRFWEPGAHALFERLIYKAGCSVHLWEPHSCTPSSWADGVP